MNAIPSDPTLPETASTPLPALPSGLPASAQTPLGPAVQVGPSLLGAEGDAALEAVLRHRPLLAFDFDGTLAPIRARPEEVRVDPRLARVLEGLAARLPVAIVTGRAIRDVRPRLGFTPHTIVGNHGAEEVDESADDGGLGSAGLGSASGTAPAALREALDPLRRQLARDEPDLRRHGVRVEDKGVSIALHYRGSRDPELAQTLIDAVLARTRSQTDAPQLQVFGGKMVVNALAAQAPDKAVAVARLVRRFGSGAVVFAGDDVNDEPVFRMAAPHWVTIRVGADAIPSPARFRVDEPRQLVPWLQAMLSQLRSPRP